MWDFAREHPFIFTFICYIGATAAVHIVKYVAEIFK
jgi:hypothetical protein